MNCDACQENLSLFLDGELDETISSAVRAHLAMCSECLLLSEDFASILDSCRDGQPVDTVPPNSKALWCRINNIIENDAHSSDTTRPAAVPSASRGFTFGQMLSAVAGIALISSLLTVVGIRNYYKADGEGSASRSDVSQSTMERVMVKVGLIESPQENRLRRFREQQDAVEYWNRRVQERRAQWDERMREAFDRNLKEIDQAVTEYTVILEKDPQDNLSSEMLDSAMDEKMNLLRAFAEL